MRAIASSRKLVDLGPLAPRTADQPVCSLGGERKAPATEQDGAGLDSKTDGRSTTEERERGRDARAVKHHRSADEPSRRPPTRRDPYAGRHHKGARAGSGLHLAVFL